MHAYDIDNAPEAVLVAPSEWEAPSQDRGAEHSDRAALTVRTCIFPIPSYLPPAYAISIAQTMGPEADSSAGRADSSAGKADDKSPGSPNPTTEPADSGDARGPAAAPGAPGEDPGQVVAPGESGEDPEQVAKPGAPGEDPAQAEVPQSPDEEANLAQLVTILESLLDRQVDAPELEQLADYPPDEVMAAAQVLANRHGNPKQVLGTLVDFLAARDLSPTYPSRRRNRKTQQAAVPNEWLAALTAQFFTPDILQATETTYLALNDSLQRARNPSQQLTPDDRPMPRKRDLDPTGKVVLRGRLDPSLSLVTSEVEWEGLARRYPRFMLSLGEHHYVRGSLVNTYECLARCMILDFSAWQDLATAHSYEMYLEAASFMVLSAHKTDQVTALYDRVPLDMSDLQRRIIEQIQRRTEIYTKARVELSNNAAISQALVDLLNTLIEDPSIDELLPEVEKRRFLTMIGEAAIARRRYQEAIGVYASLGDTKRLTEIGQMLSANVYYENQNVVTISRDIDTAIDAFREAGDTESLRNLLQRCKDTRAQFASMSEKPANFQYLDRYIQHIEDFVAPDGQARSLGLEDLSALGDASDGNQAELTKERLPDLIAQYVREVETSVPGQDLTRTREILKVLGERAIELEMFDMGTKALEVSGLASVEHLLDLGRKMVDAGLYRGAYELYASVGELAYPELAQLGQTIISRGLAPRGILNPDVEIAVDAYLKADEGARLEALLNDLLKLRVQFASMDMEAMSVGRPPIDRNQEIIERCLEKIGEVYDLVGVPKKSPGASGGSADSSHDGPTRIVEPTSPMVPTPEEPVEATPIHPEVAGNQDSEGGQAPPVLETPEPVSAGGEPPIANLEKTTGTTLSSGAASEAGAAIVPEPEPAAVLAKPQPPEPQQAVLPSASLAPGEREAEAAALAVPAPTGATVEAIPGPVQPEVAAVSTPGGSPVPIVPPAAETLNDEGPAAAPAPLAHDSGALSALVPAPEAGTTGASLPASGGAVAVTAGKGSRVSGDADAGSDATSGDTETDSSMLRAEPLPIPVRFPHLVPSVHRTILEP